MKLLALFILLSSTAIGQTIGTVLPKKVEKTEKYLFYLHGGVVTELGNAEEILYSSKTINKMKMIPIFKCQDMKEAISFYTNILDFELKEPDASPNDWVVALVNEEAEILLTSLEGDQKPGFAVNVLVDEIDELFGKYIKRGLDTSHKEGSPVHQGPINQSWGSREFYVTDPTGNTLRFCQPIA